MPMQCEQNNGSANSGAAGLKPNGNPGVVVNFPISDTPVNLTEDDVAEDFALKYRDTLRFDHRRGKWYVRNDVCWSVNETGLAFDHARHLCRKHRGSQTKMASKKAADGVEHMARMDHRLAVTSEIWDPDPLLLGTPGGTLDLTLGTLREPKAEDFITKLVAVTPAPKGTPCPVFGKFLEEATAGDKNVQRFLQQWAGYCLTGLISEQALLFIYGPGGNGKSVFLNILSDIMGGYAKNAAIGTFAATNHQRHLTELAMLCGSRLVTASETETGQKWSEVRINQLTGGDPVTANYMRQDHFTYQPQFKIMIVGNHKPQLPNVNEAARRRFNIVPFLHKPKEPDKALPEKLRSEYPAILQWAIEGCMDWMQNGLVKPDIVTKATSDYFDEQDLLGRWIDEECECGLGKQDSANNLYASWESFAKANGEEPGTATNFGTRLPERGFLKKKSGKTLYIGIKVKVYIGIKVTESLEDLSDQI
jgi:putative DNA primase/helicase